jgi:hypothetical protein
VGPRERKNGKRAVAVAFQSRVHVSSRYYSTVAWNTLKTPAYRIGYAIMAPLMPLLRSALPNLVLTTEQIGLAMPAVAKHGAPKQILESKDIRAVLA